MSRDDLTTRGSDDTPEFGRERRLVLRSVLPGDESALELTGARKRWVLGRGEDCDLRLVYTGVSRRHAEIERHGPVFSIRDSASTNGTHVGGQRVEHESLAPGAVLRLGGWLGVVEEHGARERGPYHLREVAPGVWGGALLARTLEPLLRAADSKLPLVLVGRTGAGKERFAHALHLASTPAQPFQAVNCAALPPALAEAELFGYRKGAFTGAERAHEGHLRAARRGTLFLDEVAELPLSLQAKLLRALDSGDIASIGETRAAHFEARVVAACQVPLGELVMAGQFREDLAARLSGLVIVLPDLAARCGDVPGLFDTLLRKHSAGTAPRVTTKFYERLCLHAWPANVRELELLARQLLATHGLEPALRRSHLPASFRSGTAMPSARTGPADGAPTVERFADALRGAQGNVKKAAATAGISRQRAYRLIHGNGLTNLVVAAREPKREGEDGRDL